MFVDKARIKLIAGKGGDGSIAWRREKYIPKGGPFGGNGGRGADIIFQASHDIYSLDHFRRKNLLKAPKGMPGGSNLKQGKSGGNLIVQVPCGTIVKDGQTDEILHDFTIDGEKWVACIGGKGGKGNACFKTSTNRAPNKCTPGKLGEEKEIYLELKLIADIGLVGLPNAGKSTLMSLITHASVKIAAYPFTTLSPNLSYVQFEDFTRALIADIPGIIKNAHQDKGLGFSFLKHIERTSMVVFVIDIAPLDTNHDPFEDFAILQKELKAYDPKLLDKKFIVLLNKCDKEGAEKNIKSFTKRYPFNPNTLLSISSVKGTNLPLLLETLRIYHAKGKQKPAKEHQATP